MAVTSRAGIARQITLGLVCGAQHLGLVSGYVLRRLLQDFDKLFRMPARLLVVAGDEGQHSGGVRGRHRRALDRGVALVGWETAAREQEARYLERPVGRDVEVLEGRRQISVGVWES